MITTEQLATFQSSVTNANSILILFSPQATLDQVAAATALFQGFQVLGKQVSLLSPAPMEQPAVIGLEAATHQVGNKNLQISFPYQEEMVDKVSYHIDDQQQKFYLIIQPRKGAQPIDSTAVEFTYTGTDADMIILVGVNALDDLEQLYIGFEDLYANSSTVSINTHDTTFGNLKLNLTGMASFCESIWQLLENVGVEPTADIATNLLTGIESATESFRSLAATADTFEVVSKLLRVGGRRVARGRTSSTNGLQNSVKSQAAPVLRSVQTPPREMPFKHDNDANQNKQKRKQPPVQQLQRMGGEGSGRG